MVVHKSNSVLRQIRAASLVLGSDAGPAEPPFLAFDQPHEAAAGWIAPSRTDLVVANQRSPVS